MGYFIKVFLFLTLTTILNGSPTMNNKIDESKVQTESITEEVSVPCVNKKKVLGESDVGIECVPLTGHDRDQVLRIDNALKSFEEEVEREEDFEKESEDLVEKINTANVLVPDDGGLINMGELKIGEKSVSNNISPVNIGENLIPTDDNFEEGSGFVDSLDQKTDKVLLKAITTKDNRDKIANPQEGTATSIVHNTPNKVLENEKSPSLNIPLIENETNLSMIYAAPKRLSTEEPAESNKVSTTNFNFSSAVAGWAAGFFGTFTLIAIGAMCVKNREKKEKKNKKFAVEEEVQDEEEMMEMT